MTRKKVLVLGGNFGGLTAALAVQHELHGDVDVTVVSASDHFLFNPSLIWLTFESRTPEDITFPLAPTFESHGVEFVHGAATELDLAGHEVVTSTGMKHVDEGRLVLDDDRTLDFAHAMIMPPFLGQQVVADATDIADDKGYVRVRDTDQTEVHDDVYAVGTAAAVTAPWTTPAIPIGIPKTGLPTEPQTHVAASNIAAQIRGEQPTEHKAFGDVPAVCVMDAGNNAVLILADKMLPPRKHGVMIPGPQSHAMKLAFETYFLWKSRHGYVNLP